MISLSPHHSRTFTVSCIIYANTGNSLLLLLLKHSVALINKTLMFSVFTHTHCVTLFCHLIAINNNGQKFLFLIFSFRISFSPYVLFKIFMIFFKFYQTLMLYNAIFCFVFQIFNFKFRFFFPFFCLVFFISFALKARVLTHSVNITSATE